MKGVMPYPPRARLGVESLEKRALPSLAPWSPYLPQVGDKVDALIRQLLPGTRSGGEFFEDLSGWLSTSIAPRVRGPGDASTFLAQRAGDCTVRSTIFQTVAERLGIAVHTVALHHVPFQENHEADEVDLHGHWSFFDPTSGVYLVDRGGTAPLGLREARAHPARAQLMESTRPLFLGRWSTERHFVYAPAPADLLRWHGHRAFELHYTYFVAPAVISGPNVPSTE
jgi:hypothetical protein